MTGIFLRTYLFTNDRSQLMVYCGQSTVDRGLN